MTEKNVLIFVRGEQQYEGVEPDVTELMTEGTMIVAENGDTVLSYQETELTGMEDSRRHSHPGPLRRSQLTDRFSKGEAAQLLL